MPNLAYILISLLASISIYSQEKLEVKKSINFTQKGEKGEKLRPEDFAGYGELNTWASQQSFRLFPDSNEFGLKDGICRMIPEEGLEFSLVYDRSMKTEIYLHLDLTTYEALENVNPPVRTLFVYVNGIQKKTVYFKKGHKEKNPLVIEVDPAISSDGIIRVKLLPASNSGGGRFWGIWDAFYTTVKEKPLP
jgi:hypothetical protein